MSGGHFDFYGCDPRSMADALNGQWSDEEINGLFFDMFGGGWDGYRRPFAGGERRCEFGPRGGGLYEALDFWLSGDTSEENYREEVSRFKRKWLAKKTPRNRVEFYQGRFEEYAREIIEKFKVELTT